MFGTPALTLEIVLLLLLVFAGHKLAQALNKHGDKDIFVLYMLLGAITNGGAVGTCESICLTSAHSGCVFSDLASNNIHLALVLVIFFVGGPMTFVHAKLLAKLQPNARKAEVRKLLPR